MPTPEAGDPAHRGAGAGRRALDRGRLATAADPRPTDTRAGMHFADLPTEGLADKTRIVFTFFWPQADRWEGGDFEVTVEG